MIKDEIIRAAIEELQGVIAKLYAMQARPCWKSFDGRVTPIDQMQNQHLVNAAAQVLRDPYNCNALSMPMLLVEIDRRGLKKELAYRQVTVRKWTR